MGTKFHMKVADLCATHARQPAKEMLIVRVLRVREGMAGKTPKWECDFIDDNSSQSVLLADAWGEHIGYAKAHLQEGKVYKITNYLITPQGKALTFGNNTIKLALTSKTGIDHVPEEHPSIPLRLPLSDLVGIFDLKATRVVSLVLAVASPAASKDVQLRKTQTSRPVTNVLMKAKSLKIELAAWGPHAAFMSNRTREVRIDFVQVIPSADGSSVKLSTIDATTFNDATEEECTALHADMAADEDMRTATRAPLVGKRQVGMSKQTSVTNIEMLTMCLQSGFDPSVTSEENVLMETYEIPSVMFMSVVGTDQTDVETLSYKGCPKCNFKELGQDGVCAKCGGTLYEDRYILHCTISDPTGSVDGTIFHQAAEEFLADDELSVKPCVALVNVGPDSRTPRKHALEIFALKPMFTASGLLNVFRAPPARFPCSGTRVVPTYPDKVMMNGMSQTSVYGNFCSHVRFLLKVTSSKPMTEVQDQVDGMRCQHTAECCLTSARLCLTLAGCFDAVAPLYALKKKDIVHVLCTPSGNCTSDNLAIYTPLKIYAIRDEDKDTLLKAFKFEVAQVEAHFAKTVEMGSPHDTTPDAKRKAADNQTFSSPGWSSPPRRLKISKTDDATKAGLGLQKPPSA